MNNEFISQEVKTRLLIRKTYDVRELATPRDAPDSGRYNGPGAMADRIL
ncbi:hypothetical protein [Sodalis sp. RH22]